jgi:SAM-dependent methyltransferase
MLRIQCLLSDEAAIPVTLATLARKIRSVSITARLNRQLGRLRGDERQFVQAAYEFILRRAADETALAPLLTLLEQGTPRRVVVEVLLLTSFTDSLHTLRCDLVRQLPPAEVVVDIGGACGNALEGSLLKMTYPHAPREITIIDLPPDTRLGSDGFAHLDRESNQWRTFGATRVRYLHQSMTDLSGVEDESVDLVWAGQSIEHITEAEARQTLSEVMRVLRPGGSFCLDTPNREITRRQFPHELIHVEHKIEYTVPQLTRLLTEAGFEIVEVKGVAPMPRTARTGVYQPGEVRPDLPLSDRPDISYIIYAHAKKP